MKDKKLEFKNSLKSKISDEHIKHKKIEQFTKQLDENEEILQNLSIDSLKKLNNYYDTQINLYKSKIENLKKANNN